MTELRLEGRLEESNLAKLMYSICRTGETGTLYLMRGAYTACVYINKGKVVFASSNDPDYRLGELLVKHGQITYAQYMTASDRLQPGKRLGTVLVELGYLSAADLYHYVVEQVKEIIFALFTWTEGQFRFEIGALPSKEVITLNISTADLVLEGIKQIVSWGRVREAAGGLDSLYEVAPDLDKRLEGLTLTEGEKRLLDLVKECRNLGRILENTKYPDFDACRLLWAFSIIGLVNQRDAMEAEVGDLLGEALGDEAPNPSAPPSAPPSEEKPRTVTVSAATAPAKPGRKPSEVSAAPPEAVSAPAVKEEQEEIGEIELVMPSSPGAALDLDAEEEEISGAADSGAALEENLKRFNDKHGYLFTLVQSELGAAAQGFVHDALDKLDRRHLRIFDGASVSEEGVFPADILAKNIRGNSLRNFEEGLDALVALELEAAKGVFKNPARMMVIRKGVKRFEGKGE